MQIRNFTPAVFNVVPPEPLYPRIIQRQAPLRKGNFSEFVIYYLSEKTNIARTRAQSGYLGCPEGKQLISRTEAQAEVVLLF